MNIIAEGSAWDNYSRIWQNGHPHKRVFHLQPHQLKEAPSQTASGWATRLNGPYAGFMDGVWVDEFTTNSKDDDLSDWVDHLVKATRIFKDESDKQLAVTLADGPWVARKQDSRPAGVNAQRLVTELSEVADFVVSNVYYRESMVPDFNVNPDPFSGIRDQVSLLRRLGIDSRKLLVGLSMEMEADSPSHNRNDVPEIDYIQFCRRMVEECLGNTFQSIAGIMIYQCQQIHVDVLDAVDATIANYVRYPSEVTGRVTRLKDYGDRVLMYMNEIPTQPRRGAFEISKSKSEVLQLAIAASINVRETRLLVRTDGPIDPELAASVSTVELLTRQ